MIRRALAAALCAFALAASAAFGASRPSVLLVTVDTLRPDALGWVAGRNATPAIDALAREGVRFPAAISPVPLTLPSHTSLLTGLEPPRHGVRDNGQALAAGVPTLAETLRRDGYATAAFVSGFPLDSAFGLDRGFQVYDDRLPDGERSHEERAAPATTAAALAWLRSAPCPWFVWVHYYDPHYPYEPPAGLRGAGKRGNYDGEVRAVDGAVAELERAAKKLAGGELLTVLTADHGESLGEHGEATHGFFVYDSTVLVPLVVHWPGHLAPRESRAAARLVDVMPTLLQLIGSSPVPGVDGVGLLPILAGKATEIPPAYSETYQPWTSYGWSPLRAIRHGGWKLIAAPRPELFDLGRDPQEQTNLVDRERPKARDLERRLRVVTARPSRAAGAVLHDETSTARLRALGYLGAGSSPGEPPAGLADPKDRLAVRDLLTEGEELMMAGEFAAAARRFDLALASDPGNRFAALRGGVARLELGRTAEAVEQLTLAVRLDPTRVEARATLAAALARAKRHDEAVAQLREWVRLQPRRAEAWATLGNALGVAGRPREAAEALARAIELEPADPSLRVRLAFAAHAAGDSTAAARHLADAARAWKDGEFPHAGALGVLLFDAGKAGEAKPWLVRSRPREPEFSEARLRLATIELKAGDRAAARRAVEEAIAASPQARDRVLADSRLAQLLH